MTFCVVTVGRNCEQWAQRSLLSIAGQSEDTRVCVIDDASEDGTPAIVEHFARENGWCYQLNTEQVGSMRNQWDAWHALEPGPDDVVVWVDLDDRLAHPNALRIVKRHYSRGMLLTYGNYRPDPASHPSAKTCPAPRPYPKEVLRNGTLRKWIADGGGIRFNHLRTVSGRIMAEITEEDCRDRDGEWFQSSPDTAVMTPALEMAGTRHAMLSEVLYLYTCDNEYSEWRRWPKRVDTDHRDIMSRPGKATLR